MKKIIALLLAVVMLFAFAACGSKTYGKETKDQTETQTNETDNTDKRDGENEDGADEQTGTDGENKPADDGTLTISLADAAIVINGNTVKMPYRFDDLVEAGAPAEDSYKEIELKAEDFFSLNFYLDEDMDYLIVPSYHNDGEETINITEAEAEGISMISYADAPEDQGVSILGVKFGMTKSEVSAMFGEPALDWGDCLQWLTKSSDSNHEGNLTVFFTADADDGIVSEVDLSFVDWDW